MAMKITDSCVACGSRIDERPISAIIDDTNNPEGEDRYYICSNKCVECVGHNSRPACANACPADGCIVWSEIASRQPSRENTSNNMKSDDTPVFV